MKFTQAFIIAAAASSELWALTSAAAISSSSSVTTTFSTHVGKPSHSSSSSSSSHHVKPTSKPKPHHHHGDNILEVLRTPEDLEHVHWMQVDSGHGRIGLVEVGGKAGGKKPHPSSHSHSTPTGIHTIAGHSSHSSSRSSPTPKPSPHQSSSSSSSSSSSTSSLTHDKRAAPSSSSSSHKSTPTTHHAKPTSKPSAPSVFLGKYKNGPYIDDYTTKYACAEGQTGLATDSDVQSIALTACEDLQSHLPTETKGDYWEIWQQANPGYTLITEDNGSGSQLSIGVRSHGSAPSFDTQLCQTAITNLLTECKSELTIASVGGIARVEGAEPGSALSFVVAPPLQPST